MPGLETRDSLGRTLDGSKFKNKMKILKPFCRRDECLETRRPCVFVKFKMVVTNIDRPSDTGLSRIYKETIQFDYVCLVCQRQ